MKPILLFLVLSLILVTGGILNAQPIGRTFGVRRLILDNNDLILVNNVYLIDRSGTLGIDNTGLFSPTFPNTCALLDLSSTTKGLLPPRMTNLQVLLICAGSPPEGLIAVNLTKHSLDFYNGSVWTEPWMTRGNYGSDPTVDYIGTNEATDFVFRTSVTERMRILAGGNVAIGVPTAVNTHVQITESGPQTALNVTSTGSGTGVNITTGNSNNLLVVNGRTDATVANVAADLVWDSRINGDQLVTGIQKIGGSIWLDGRSPTHQIVTDAPVNIGTKNGNTIGLVTGNTQRLTIDATGNTTITGGNTTINEGTNEFTINGTGSGYAANVNTNSLLGLEVHCKAQTGTGLNSNTHFVDFYDRASANPRGSIQGQDFGEYFADPINIANAAVTAANVIVAAAELVAAAASAATVIGIPEGVGFAAQAVGIAVQIAQYGIITGIQTTTGLGISYSSSSGDYAEYLKRDNSSDKLYPGDIVGVKNGLISKNTEGAQSVYSISLAPIVLGNVPPKGEEAEYNKVGFLGQVPVKVRGAAHEGDFIIASGLNDGIGVAVSSENITPQQFTMVIGRAWTSSELAGIKYIKVAVGLNAKAMSEIMSHEQSEIDNLKNEVKELRKSNAEVTSMKAKLDRIEKYLSQPEKITKDVMLRSN